MMRLFVSAGEASGDAYGAALLEALRNALAQAEGSHPTALRVQAVGGPRLGSLGIEMVADSTTWGAIGIVKSLGVGPKVILGYLRAKSAMAKGVPGLFVPIDFGTMNIRLARFAKRHGWKVLYFIPPGSWRRDRQGRDLAAITDAIVTPFSWSAEILNQMGAKAYWFGHPTKSLMKGSAPAEASPNRTGVAVLPGSRHHEIIHNLPAIAGAVKGLPPVEFAVAPTLDLPHLTALWAQLAGPRNDVFTEGDVFGVLSRARAAIVCSGTATLQAALTKCPMVVMYRFSKVMGLEILAFGLRRKVRFISLPNIFLERAAVPELLQEDASPANIRRHLDTLLAESPERAGQLAAFEELDGILGGDDCIEQTAELIVGMVSRCLTPPA